MNITSKKSFQTFSKIFQVSCLVESESNVNKQINIIGDTYEGKSNAQTSVINAIKENDAESAMQIINTLIEETRHLKSGEQVDEFKTNFTLRVLKDLSNASIAC